MAAPRWIASRLLSELLLRLRRFFGSTRGGKTWILARVAFVLVALLVLGEILARVFGPPGYEVTFFQTSLHFPDDEFVEDRDLFWAPVEGFGDRLRAAAAYRGPNLVYVFGGSIAKGILVQKGFAPALEEMLLARVADAKVVNFGVQGYTTYQSRVLAQRVCRRRAPQVLVLTNAYNDLQESPYMTDAQAAARNHSLAVRALFQLNKSRLFGLYRRVLLGVRGPTLREPIPGGAAHQRVPLADYRANLAAFADLARAGGFDLILVAQPMPSRDVEAALEPYFTAMREAAASDPRVHFADPRPLFAAYRAAHDLPYPEDGGPVPNALFVDRICHPTDLGHRFYAEAILDTMLAERLLKR